MGRRRSRSTAEVCRRPIHTSALECLFGGPCPSLRDVIVAPTSRLQQLQSPARAVNFIKDRTATADGLFNTALFVLLGGVGLYKAYQRSMKAKTAAKAAVSEEGTETKASNDDKSVKSQSSIQPNAGAKPKSIKSLQLRFLPVFWLLRLAFWMAGPYFYPVYASKIINGTPASARLISNIFLAGFAAIVIFAPLTGKGVDQYGRKKGTLAAVVLYAFGALSTKANVVVLLFLGRAIGGVGTNLLNGAPESWLVSEAMMTGDDNDGTYLKETFGMAYAFDPLVAIAAGQIAGAAAGYAGPTGPFTIMPLFLIVGGLIVLLTWRENKGGMSGGGGSSTADKKLPEKRGPASTSRRRATPNSPTGVIDENRRKSDGGYGYYDNWDSDSDSEAEVDDFVAVLDARAKQINGNTSKSVSRRASDFATPPNHSALTKTTDLGQCCGINGKRRNNTANTSPMTKSPDEPSVSMIRDFGVEELNDGENFGFSEDENSLVVEDTPGPLVPHVNSSKNLMIKEVGVMPLKGDSLDRRDSHSTLGSVDPSDFRQNPQDIAKDKMREKKIKQFRRESIRRRGSSRSNGSGLNLVRMPSLNNLVLDEMDDTPQVRDGLKIVMTDHKMLMLGAVQSLFEGSMYIFVMQWPPALIMAVKGYYGPMETVPFGTIFSCFMACCMVGSTIFGKLTSRKGASMERLFLGMLLVSALSMGAATWAIYAGHDFVTLVLSLFAFEGAVGMYFPLIGFMRGKYLYASHRSVIMTLFSVPLNVLVVSVCLFLSKLGTTGAFVVATVALTVAAGCMAWLIHIRRREARRHWMEVKKALRRLSLTKKFVEVVEEKRDEKRRQRKRGMTRENSGNLRMALRESVRDSIRMGAIMGA